MNEQLRRGWTTGACATGGATAAYAALLSGEFPDPVEVVLPKGRRVEFALATHHFEGGSASAGIIKDAGDDPDVTHGALIVVTVSAGEPGSGVTFHAGDGVGTVTRPGLPLAVGEPAINPVPRRLITEAVQGVAERHQAAGDVAVRVDIPSGAEMARHTWNPRLGIVGGLSILGTTGVVIPYSCSAWIDSIRSGIDVARALGITHVAGSAGSTSEAVVTDLHQLPESALLDMGDFAGAVLKHLRKNPVPRLTIAGGFAKMSKLAAGHLDLHSQRSEVDLELLAELARDEGFVVAAGEIGRANSALHALELAEAAGFSLGTLVAGRARATALEVLGDAPVGVDIVVIDRSGRIVGRTRNE